MAAIAAPLARLGESVYVSLSLVLQVTQRVSLSHQLHGGLMRFLRLSSFRLTELPPDTAGSAGGHRRRPGAFRAAPLV